MASIQDRLRLPLTISTNQSPAPGKTDGQGRALNSVGIKKVSEREVMRRYTIGEHVMESTNAGMDVMQATRLSDNLPVVIKIRQRPGSFKTPELEREWRRTTEVQLGMPKTDRLCQYFEVLETDKAYYIVMEKVEGKDLFEVMSEDKPDLEGAREIVRQVLEALAVLHSHGRIHKDLKIENVMVDVGAMSPQRRRQPPTSPASLLANAMSAAPSAGGALGAAPISPASHSSPGGSGCGRRGVGSPALAKLIDFDTVVDWEPTSPKAKEVLGTDGYIAPEAYLGQYSPASDIYAAGVVMYKTLTGDFPTREDIFDDAPGENWVGSPSMKRIYSRLQSERVDFDKPPFNTDHAAADLCSRLLALEAADRPSAEEALRHEWFFVAEP